MESRNVGIDVIVRGRERMAHACLGGEMDHGGETVRGKQRRHAVAVIEIELVEPERIVSGEFRKARLLELGIVIGIEVVEADDTVAVRQQSVRDMESDESGGAGDQNRRSRHVVQSFSPVPTGSRSRDPA